MAQPVIVVAGAAGDLGARVAKALIARNAAVRALVRNDVSADDRNRLAGMGAAVAPADVADVGSVASACEGATCVVSALNGLREVIVDRQGVLLDGAVKAGVPRFISSDYSADFTGTRTGDNRNLDLRREFMARADAVAARAPIRVTSVLNGAFMDMLGAEMPVIQPRILRIAGDSVSARGIAQAMTEVTDKRYRTLWAGSIGSLSVLIRLAKIVAPQPGAAFPPWQGMRDMFSGRGKLHPLDNNRYPEFHWTSVREQFAVGSASARRRRAS